MYRMLCVLVISIFASTLVTTASAKSKQQNVFLDAKGNPIPNDILLSLSSSGKKRVTSRRPPANSNQAIRDLLAGTNNKKRTSKSKIKKSTTAKSYQFNPALEKDLFYAMKSGNVARVDQLIKAGIRPTYKNYKGETPLGLAVTRGWASMVVRLLQNGADINEKGARGVTLLHSASARGLTDVAKVLVKHGLNPGQRTDKNWTPLHVAARYGHWQLVQFFIKVGVDPNIRNSDGKTALGLARHLRHMGVIKMLSQVTTVRSLNFSEVKKQKRRKKRKSKKRR